MFPDRATRASRARRVAGGAAAAIALAATTAACDVHEPIVIPAGAQVIRVTVSDTEIALQPASVHAGDVYLVNEGPAPDFTFVARSSGPGADAEPMSDADVERLALGDFQFTSMEGFSVSCAPDQWTEGRHWEGCGENVALTLSAGRYAILAGAEEPGVAPVMAVLDVDP